jgi:hypothetical protein
MDALPTLPLASVRLSSKLSQSSAAIVDQRPVTAEDLDDVLKDLAKFDMGSPSKETPDTSTPRPASVSPTLPLSTDFSSDLTSELYPLHSGEQLPLGLMGDDTPIAEPCESDKGSGVAEEDEFSQVQVEDSNSYLEQLGSEVSHLQDEVLEEEGRLAEEMKEEEGKKKSHGRRLSSQRSMPRIPVAEPNVLLTPETKRRIMEEIEINVESPKDESHKKEAVDTLIGEVFDDVSFDEFEEENLRSGRSSGRISGSLTPSSARPGSGSRASADMSELLSALNAVGSQQARIEVSPAVQGVSTVVETQHAQEVVKLEAAPPVSNVSLAVSEEGGKSHTLSPKSETVLLRAEPGSKDPTRRMSAPPKVAEKPARTIDPDKLSFKEKLALHKKTLEVQGGSSVSPVRPPLQPSSSREGYRRPTTPELAVQRSSEQDSTTPFSDETSTDEVMSPTLSKEQLSAEERRLNRIVNRPAKVLQ